MGPARQKGLTGKKNVSAFAGGAEQSDSLEKEQSFPGLFYKCIKTGWTLGGQGIVRYKKIRISARNKRHTAGAPAATRKMKEDTTMENMQELTDAAFIVSGCYIYVPTGK